jgi:hypothetical protein
MRQDELRRAVVSHSDRRIPAAGYFLRGSLRENTYSSPRYSHGGGAVRFKIAVLPGTGGEMAVLARMTAAGMDAATYDQASTQLAGLVKMQPGLHDARRISDPWRVHRRRDLGEPGTVRDVLQPERQAQRARRRVRGDRAARCRAAIAPPPEIAVPQTAFGPLLIRASGGDQGQARGRPNAGPQGVLPTRQVAPAAAKEDVFGDPRRGPVRIPGWVSLMFR